MRQRWGVAGVGALTALLSCAAPLPPGSAPPSSAPETPREVDERVCELVESEFFDPALGGVDWAALRREGRAQAAAAADVDELRPLLEPMLAALGSSHTRFITASEPAFFHLADIFGLAAEFGNRFPDGTVGFDAVGLFTRRLEAGLFVSGVLHGSPAALAGVLVGDRLVSVEGAPFEPVASFAGRSGQRLRLLVQRKPHGADRRQLTIVPRRVGPKNLLLEASEASMLVEQRDGIALAYARIWSYADPRVHELLVEAVSSGPLAAADALVLDLRGGWGGADPAYLDLFNTRVPLLEMIARDGELSVFDSHWRKPVVLLVDGDTRSGKELLAHGFRRFGIGPVVGAATAGAVVGGRVFPLGEDALLYLAVVDARVDGRRLEGVGVAPDVPVPFELPYAAGADPRRERALALAAELVARERR